MSHVPINGQNIHVDQMTMVSQLFKTLVWDYLLAPQ